MNEHDLHQFDRDNIEHYGQNVCVYLNKTDIRSHINLILIFYRIIKPKGYLPRMTNLIKNIVYNLQNLN